MADTSAQPSPAPLHDRVRRVARQLLEDETESDNGKADAARDVALLSYGNLEVCKQFVELGIVMELVRLLAHPDDEAKQNAAIALATLGSTNELKLAVARAGAIPPLVELLCSNNAEVVGRAIAAVANLAVNKRLQEVILSRNVLEIIAQLLTLPADGMRTAAAGALSSLLFRNESARVDALSLGLVSVLMDMLAKGSEQNKIAAAGALRTFSVSVLACGGIMAERDASTILLQSLLAGGDLRSRTLGIVKNILSFDEHRGSLLVESKLVVALVAVAREDVAEAAFAAGALRFALAHDGTLDLLLSLRAHSLPLPAPSAAAASAKLALLAAIAFHDKGGAVLLEGKVAAECEQWLTAHAAAKESFFVALLAAHLIRHAQAAVVAISVELPALVTKVAGCTRPDAAGKDWTAFELTHLLNLAREHHHASPATSTLSLAAVASATSHSEHADIVAWHAVNRDVILDTLHTCLQSPPMLRTCTLIRACMGSWQLGGARVVAERTLVSGNWLRLVEREWTDGVSGGKLWEAVDRTSRPAGATVDGVEVIATLKSEGVSYIVLVLIFRAGAGVVSVEVPAGLVDPLEDVSTSAVRELKEETGYTCVVKTISAPTCVCPWESSETSVVVTAEIDGDLPENKNPQPQREADECMETILVPVDILYSTLQEYAKLPGYSVNTHLYTYALALHMAGQSS